MPWIQIEIHKKEALHLGNFAMTMFEYIFFQEESGFITQKKNTPFK
jgi:hypothetical protein